MKVALEERYKQGKASTISRVIVRPSDWENIPVLRDIQVLPKTGKPISNLPDQEQEHAFWKVGKEIKGTVEALGEADKDVGPDPVSDPVQKKGPLLLNPLITILIPCLKLITRRWIWAVIGVIVLLSGVLWGASSPTVPYIEIPRGSYYYFSTANNGDVYIYPVNWSTFFVARRNDFSSPIDSTKTDQTKWLLFFARPDMISVDDTIDTIQGKQYVTQAHVIEQLTLYDQSQIVLATYTARDYNSNHDYYESWWWPTPVVLIGTGLVTACVALFVRPKRRKGA